LLKSGLYNEYFEDLKKAIPQFMDPKVYGRSILENSSFIAPSNNPNPNIQGKGFIARLTGSSSEAITMWIQMFLGKKIFTYNNQLEFKVNPILTSDFFKDGKISFKLFNHIDVTYIATKEGNTFGENKIKPMSYKLTYVNKESKTIETVIGKDALDIREGLVTSIEVTLG